MELKNAEAEMKSFEAKKKFFQVLLQNHKPLLLIFFLIFLLFYGYLWYLFVYDAVWSESQKTEYVESQSNQNITFNETKLNEIVAEIEKRRSEYARPIEISRDIFKVE